MTIAVDKILLIPIHKDKNPKLAFLILEFYIKQFLFHDLLGKEKNIYELNSRRWILEALKGMILEFFDFDRKPRQNWAVENWS